MRLTTPLCPSLDQHHVFVVLDHMVFEPIVSLVFVLAIPAELDVAI